MRSPSSKSGAVTSVFCVLVALAGCEPEGSVHLQFLLPESENLSPASAALTHITLISAVPGEPDRSETRSVEDRTQPLSLGRLDVGNGATLTVELRSATERLLGYGQSITPVEVIAHETVQLPIMVRKPFVYLTGDARLTTFDPTSNADEYSNTIQTTGTPSLVVPERDGAGLIAVAASGNGGVLQIISTSTHQPVEIPTVSLMAAPSDAIISRDNRFAVIAHAGAAGGISIVDLDAAYDGIAEAVFVPIGNVGGVTLGQAKSEGLGLPSEMVYALVNRATSNECGQPNSSIAVVALTEGVVDRTVAYGTALRDVASAEDSNTLVGADPCNNELTTLIVTDDIQGTTLARLQDASATAVLGNRVWGVGSIPPSGDVGARLLLVSIDVNGSGEVRVELPAAQERALSTDFSSNSQAAEQRINADEVVAHELAVVPGGDHVALLTRARFESDSVGSFLGAPIIPAMQMETYEYVLVDASTNSYAQRLRTSCDLQWTSDPFNPPVLDSWLCTQAPQQQVSTASYEPKQLSVLFGTR